MKPKPLTIECDEAPSASRIFAKHQGKFSARAADGITEISLIGEVGFDGLTEGAVRDQLGDARDVRVLINSPGGDVFAGIGIFNALAAHHGKVSVEITGLAASAASIIAMAGDSIAMATGSHLMIHESWTVTIGNTHRHADGTKLLSKIDAALAEVYSQRSGRSAKEMRGIMAAETWFSADEAIKTGLADAKLSVAATMCFDLGGVFKNTPAALGQPSNDDDSAGDATQSLIAKLAASTARLRETRSNP